MKQPDLFSKEYSLSTGEALKELGIESVAQHNWTFVEMMRYVAKQHSRKYGSVSSDDLRIFADMHGLFPDHPNAWGAIFKANKSGKGWTKIGYKKSKKRTNHAREIKIWRWNDS